MTPYNGSSVQPIPEGDAGVALTLSYLRSYVSQSQTSELAHAAVQAALRDTAEKDAPGEVAAIFDWVRARYRYTNDPLDVELVRDPRYLLREIDRRGWVAGDCDDAAGLLAALLETAGYPTRFVVQAGPGESFSHVLVEVQVDGTWLPLDLTHGTAGLGWRPSVGVAREATERGRGMLGQDEFSDPGGGVLTSWFTPGPNPVEIVSAPAVLTGDTTAAGASKEGTSDFFSRLFSKDTLAGALALAERYGITKPVVGYTADGKPIYASQTLPLSTGAAGFTTLTQAGPLGISGLGWLLIIGGTVVLLPRMLGRRR